MLPRVQRGVNVARPKCIGLNILFLIPGNVGGTEIYTRKLLQALADIDSVNAYYVYRNRETEGAVVPKAPNFHDRPQNVRATSRPARLLFEQSLFLIAIARDRLDVLFNLGFTAPLFAWMPMATVFYDLQYKHFPHMWKKLDLIVARLLFPACARRSTKLVAMSETVRADLEKFYPWSSSRIVLVPHGSDPDFVRVRERRASEPPSEQKFILTVSSLMPHKNYENLFLAFARFRSSHPDFTLVVAGFKGLDALRLEELRTKFQLDDAVTFTGWIPREELLTLFVRADAFVYASNFEGFGIPVLEALTAGVPSAVSNIAPIIEIAADAVRYFDPSTIDDIANAIGEVVDNHELRANLSREGPRRAEQFASRNTLDHLVTTLTSLARS